MVVGPSVDGTVLGDLKVGAEACWGLSPLDQEERVARCGSE